MLKQAAPSGAGGCASHVTGLGEGAANLGRSGRKSRKLRSVSTLLHHTLRGHRMRCHRRAVPFDRPAL